MAESGGARLGAFARGVLGSTVVGPVREGRIRDHGWPYGLRAVVLLGYLAFACAGVLVVASGAVRQASTLEPGGSTAVGLPVSAVWMLTTLFSFGLSLLLTAGLRAPWWLRLLALLVVLAALSAWSLRTPGTSGSAWWPLVVLLLLVGLVVLVVVRSRRPFAWWELGAVWAISAACLVVGLVENRYSIDFGADQVPLLLQYLAATLGYLVLPTAMVAGAAVAEVCLRLTVAATEQAQRLARDWVPYAVLGLVVAVRGVQVARGRLTRPRALGLAGALTICALFSGRDFISDPVGAVIGFSGAALVLFGLVWDLFTGSGWANGESRRFARPTRVLLVLANSVITMSVLAFAALVRDGSTTIYLDPYAEFGDLVFGTALLAAGVVAVLAPTNGELAGSSGEPTVGLAPVSSSTSQAHPV